MSSSNTFASDGFDLDAANSTEAILEIGGGPTAEVVTADSDELADALHQKKLGNEAFKQQKWLEAYDYYSSAIEVTPGNPTGNEIRAQYEEWMEVRQKEMRADLQKQEEERRKEHEAGEEEPQRPKQPEPKFIVDPQHPHAKDLSTFYCNRAASLLYLDRNEEARDDCDICLWLNPTYVKAWSRRSTAYEALEDTEAALKDAKEALTLDPSNRTIQVTVKRLEKVEAERMEKLKEETMGKLKDLGNSILGNFGLSLDNFQATQDPNTGSYSINFNQNPK